jgi:hypothetical protein
MRNLPATEPPQLLSPLLDPISVMNRQCRGPLIKLVTAMRRRTRECAPVLQGGRIMKTRLREWKVDRTTTQRNQFNATRNNHHQTIRAEKNKIWYTFLFKARDREIFQALRYTKPRRKKPTPDITFQGTTATTFEEKGSVFRQALFPAPPVSHVTEASGPTSPSLPCPKLTINEIQNAIKSSSSTKAPGPDYIGFECIKKAYSTIPEYFKTLFLAPLQAGYHATCWRQATIVILKKAGKPDYSAPKAYWPISLLNCLGKVS